jgi:hypothetical protein
LQVARQKAMRRKLEEQARDLLVKRSVHGTTTAYSKSGPTDSMIVQYFEKVLRSPPGQHLQVQKESNELPLVSKLKLKREI